MSIPSPLLDSILSKNTLLFDDFVTYAKELKELQGIARRELDRENRIKVIGPGPTYPLNEVAGVDGTYHVKRTTAADIFVAASIMLGDHVLKANSETFVLPPSELSSRIAQGLMMMLEVKNSLAAESGLVLHDGSFITQWIKIHSLYDGYNRNENAMREVLKESRIKPLMEAFRHQKGLLEILGRSNAVAFAKESGATKICAEIQGKAGKSGGLALVDRVLLSSVLQPGEYLVDTLDAASASMIHSTEPKDDQGLLIEFGDGIVKSLRGLKVVYLRPCAWTPAQRIEIPASCSQDDILKIIRTTMGLFLSPTVIEPYPLYISDRICGAIGQPAEAIIAALTTKLEREGGVGLRLSDEDLQLMFRPYRTED